jgi:hypothetical protein
MEGPSQNQEAAIGGRSDDHRSEDWAASPFINTSS